jgi:arylsulfatase A
MPDPRFFGQALDSRRWCYGLEKTLVLFTGDNGTAAIGGAPDRSTVGGRRIFGQKAQMLEGGSRVPLAVSWPGTTPAGKVLPDLVDFSDFFPTFAQLAGAKLPEGVAIDGKNFAPQLKGEPGAPRQWVYVELNGRRYVRDKRWKLTGQDALFDMKEAPFNEIAVAADSTDPDAVAARKRLHEVLVGLVGEERLAQPPLPPPARRKAKKKAAALPVADTLRT